MIAKGVLRHPRVTIALTALAIAAGLFCLRILPIESFPSVAPLTFQVTAVTEGLGAEETGRLVAGPLENAFADLPDVMYHSSFCSDDSSCRCSITFKSGVSPARALRSVKDAIRRARGDMAKVPIAKEMEVTQCQDDTIALYSFSSDGGCVPSGLIDRIFRSHMLGVDGVASVEFSGARKRTVRIDLDAVKLSGLQLTTSNVVETLLAYSADGERSKAGSGVVVAEGLDGEIGNLGDVSVKENPETGGRVLLKNVADIAICDVPHESVMLDGREVVLMRVRKKADANAVETAESVKRMMEKLAKDLPLGISCALIAESSSGVMAFMRDVFVTPIVSFLLVGFALSAFWRSVKVAFSAMAVVVASVVSSFVIQYWFGFTFNALAVFGFVLIFGSLVDTSVIVIERANMALSKTSVSVRGAMEDAVRRSFGVVAASTILVVVCYVPLMFLQGMVAHLHLQFAFAACVALAMSSVFALTLAPVIFAAIVRTGAWRPSSGKSPLFCIARGWASLCNAVSAVLVRRPGIALALVFAIACCLVPFRHLLPKVLFGKDWVDRVVVELVLPPESGIDETRRVCSEVSSSLRSLPEVKSVLALPGQGALHERGDSFGKLTVEFGRHMPPREVDGICAGIRERLASSGKIRVAVFIPSPVRGVGRFDGLEFSLCSNGAKGDVLADAAFGLERCIRSLPGVQDVVCAVPQNGHRTKLSIDRGKASMFGITPGTVENEIRDAIAPVALKDFRLADGVCDVVIGKTVDAENEPEVLSRMLMPAAGGARVPVSAFGTVSVEPAPMAKSHFNGKESVNFVVRLLPGVSPERFMRTIEELPLREGLAIEWSGLAVQEGTNRRGTRILVSLTLFVLYLLLVAWYESWTLPLPAIAASLISIFGAFAGLWITGTPLNIHAQVSLVVVVGIAIKLSVLIVGASHNRFTEGATIEAAAIEGMKRTFRPVQIASWTSLAGCVPLLFAIGVGTSEQFALGIVAVSGIIAVILVGLNLIPALYVLAERLDTKLGAAPLRIRSRMFQRNERKGNMP